MSVINRFQELFGSTEKNADNGTVPVPSSKPKTAPTDPPSVGRCIAIHKGFTRKSLAAETDPEWLAAFARLAVFDEKTGYWTPPEGFTQAEAAVLQERLYALPWKSSTTKASKVTTTQAAPLPKSATVTDEAIANRVEAAEAASKASVPAEPVTGDRLARLEALVERLAAQAIPAQPAATQIPEGFEVRVGKKGPYLAKRR